jgi:preprotein translocase subunit SecE
MSESKSIKGKKTSVLKDRDPKSLSVLSWWSRASVFLQEVKGELRKVVWPSRKQVMASTGVVLVLVAIAAAFLGMVDWALSGIVHFILGLAA